MVTCSKKQVVYMLRLNVKKVESEMARLGLSKDEMARRMGLKRTSAYYYLRPQTSLRKVSRIAKVLNLDEKDLLI